MKRPIRTTAFLPGVLQLRMHWDHRKNGVKILSKKEPQNNFKFNLNQQPSYQHFRTNKEEPRDALIPSSKPEIVFLMKLCFHSTNVIHCGCFSVIPEHLVVIYFCVHRPLAFFVTSRPNDPIFVTWSKSL